MLPIFDFDNARLKVTSSPAFEKKLTFAQDFAYVFEIIQESLMPFEPLSPLYYSFTRDSQFICRDQLNSDVKIGVFWIKQRLIIGSMRNTETVGYSVIFTTQQDEVTKVQEGLFGKQCCNFEFLISSSQSIDFTAKFKHYSAPLEEKQSYTGRPDIFNFALTYFNSAV